jgi:hypothetical protein
MRVKWARVAIGRHWDRALRPRSHIANYWPLVTVSLLCILGTGCRVVQTAANVPGQSFRAVTPGKKGGQTVDPVDVQEKLLRFADEYSTRMTLGVDRLRRGTNELDPTEALKWKILIATESCSIASGPNAIADMLDMTAFVTMTRAALEEHWGPRVFGASALPMLESCRSSETSIWQIASTVLKPDQQAELRRAIEAWRRQNPEPERMLTGRALGFASAFVQANKDKTGTSGSVFDLLNFNPLSGLDPVTRQIAETRLFAERALFVTQKMPTLLRWQMELLSLKAVGMPTVQQLVTNSTEIAASVSRFARAAEQLPAQISTERQEILKALESQERDLRPLVKQVRQTLVSGTQMSTSLNTTIMTFNALMQRFGVGETNQAAPPNTNSAPFRIQEYGQTAVQVEVMARQVTDLVKALDQTLDSTNLASLAAKVSPVVQQAQTGGKQVVDYAFWKGILLVAIALAAALIYRFLAGRLKPATSSKSSSP